MADSIDVPTTRRLHCNELIRILDDARRRTLDLTRDLTGDRQFGPNLSIVNPPLWEVGHVGFFHDYFALRTLYGLPDYQQPDAERLYDSSSIHHDDRWDLPLPTMQGTLDYLESVRNAMVERLPGGEATEAQSYVYQLTILHEDMHAEAFTYTRQTLGYPPPEFTDGVTPPEAEITGTLPGDAEVPGGAHQLGSDASVPFRFDNEKQPHTVEVPGFAIARAPVTNSEYQAFVEDAGYQRPELWSKAGWQWRQEREQEAPLYWRRRGAGWEQRWFDRWLPLAPHHPVCFVSLYEAQAYCCWAGRRLPTEAEWEVAASRVPTPDNRALEPGKRLYPWGDAPPSPSLVNMDGHRLGCVDVAAFPEGDSALGCRQMLGNVWEWTSSLFKPYPGFETDLYKDYSKPWFKEGRHVLRGGAWATRSRLVHNGHRNYFTPDRNDIFAGFRTCAP
ncbi:selenoneine synthase SenA [Aquisalimonas sp.]|uniref:selenoneine synthase SenA n=1 Tax=Aquisalimonas sp. TaxID=1872621 RepID=UPI0025C389AA|nr:selenoneine synthase SenA [Aquisalimonas sp.]